MSKEPKFYARGWNVYQSPVQTETGVQLGFILCVCEDATHAPMLAKALNEHDEMQGVIQELLDHIAPTTKSQSRLTQGLGAAYLRAKAFLRKVQAP